MNKLIGVLNFSGGTLFAAGSLLFLQSVISQHSYGLQTSMCVYRQGGCPPDTLDKRQDIERSAESRQQPSIFMAMLGAGLACLRESKD